jgi:hypothetical protein
MTVGARLPRNAEVEIGTTMIDLQPGKAGAPSRLGHDRFIRISCLECIATNSIATDFASTSKRVVYEDGSGTETIFYQASSSSLPVGLSLVTMLEDLSA